MIYTVPQRSAPQVSSSQHDKFCLCLPERIYMQRSRHSIIMHCVTVCWSAQTTNNYLSILPKLDTVLHTQHWGGGGRSQAEARGSPSLQGQCALYCEILSQKSGLARWLQKKELLLLSQQPEFSLWGPQGEGDNHFLTTELSSDLHTCITGYTHVAIHTQQK